MNKSFQETNLSDIGLYDVPVIRDHRGNLAFLQHADLPFDFKRIYYLFDVPSGARRGGHAHKRQTELLIALSGSFDVILHDSVKRQRFQLNRPDRGLLIPPGIWRELENFSANSICLVLNTDNFDESDYIRDFDEFLRVKNPPRRV